MGTKIFMQWNTGKTWSEGRIVRASSADCKVLTGIWTAGRTGSRISLSEVGIRVWYFFNKKERQTHWSWIYCATIFPHPWEDDDSSEKLRQKTKSLPHLSLRLSQFPLHIVHYPYKGRNYTVIIKYPKPRKPHKPQFPNYPEIPWYFLSL